jgi:hypothetical protein
VLFQSPPVLFEQQFQQHSICPQAFSSQSFFAY